MKNRSFLRLFIFSTFIVLSTTDVFGQASVALTGYSDKANCLNNYGNCAWAVTDFYSGANNEMPATISITGASTVLIEYGRLLDADDNETIKVPASGVSVPANICTELNVQSITINGGSYTPDYTSNPNGDIVFDATIVE